MTTTARAGGVGEDLLRAWIDTCTEPTPNERRELHHQLTTLTARVEAAEGLAAKWEKQRRTFTVQGHAKKEARDQCAAELRAAIDAGGSAGVGES